MSQGWRIRNKHEGNAPLKAYGKTTTSFNFLYLIFHVTVLINGVLVDITFNTLW